MSHFSRILLILMFLIGFSSLSPNLARANEISLNFASDFFNRGLENIRQHEDRQALSNFTKVINLNSSLVNAAYNNRCLVYFRLEEYSAAKSDCENALVRNPNNTEALLTLGLVYYQLKDYTPAIDRYRQVIKLNQTDYRAYYNRGLAYFALQDYQQALMNYDKALSFANFIPNYHQTSLYSDRGLVYLMLTNYDKAISDFERAISLDSFNQLAYFNRGCAYHRQGNYSAAIEDFSTVLSLNGDRTQAYVNRGWLYHRLGLEQAAFNDLNRAIEQYRAQENQVAYQQTVALKEKLIQIISQLNLSQWG